MDLGSNESGFGWCLIPPEIASRKDLSSGEKLVYGRAYGLKSNHGYCWASNKWLGNQLGFSSGYITEVLKKLKDKGLIVVQIIVKNKQVTQRRIFFPSYVPHPVITGDPSSSHRGPHPVPAGGICSVECSVEESKDKTLMGSPNSSLRDSLGTHSGGEEKETEVSGGNGSIPIESKPNPIPKRERTKFPPPPEPKPVQEKKPDPIKSEGMALQRSFGTLLKKVNNIEVPIPTSEMWQVATELGKLVVEKGVSRDRVLSAISWYSDHYEEQYVPMITNVYEFTRNFFKIELFRKKASKSDQVEFGPAHHRQRLSYGPNGTIKHDCVITEERKKAYEEVERRAIVCTD